MEQTAMTERRIPAPANQYGIRNFAWLVDGQLARGEHPLDVESSWSALKDAGIGSIISLREAEDRARGGRPAYRAADERAVCEGLGLRFHHLPCDDFAAPSPGQVAAALAAIDDEVAAGRAVYVHCFAGVGRTGVITCAWLMTRGWSGDEAADVYFQFVDEMSGRRPTPDEDLAAYRRRVGVPQQWWTLQAIGDALGRPMRHRPDAPPAECPPGAEHWDQEYAALLRPWRR
jgi:hypothetical protein